MNSVFPRIGIRNVQYATPNYPRGLVDAAGRLIVQKAKERLREVGDPQNDPMAAFWMDFYRERDEQYEQALDMVNNWRTEHSYPLNVYQGTLRNRSRLIDSHGFVSQRIKRLAAIEDKLQRFPHMELSRMQDIGGCRSIFSSINGVYKLRDSYEESSNVALREFSTKDYILNPKSDGYRSIHLIFNFHSGSRSEWEGLRIEMQLRSAQQHFWATAVETVEAILKQSLKTGRGSPEWKRFFALMGSVIARQERAPLVPDTPTNRSELIDELREIYLALKVETRLAMYTTAVSFTRHPGAAGSRYFLLELDVASRKLQVTPYKGRELESAEEDYFAAEQTVLDMPSKEVVLVKVKSLADLPRAYPSFYLDTTRFLQIVKNALRGRRR